MNPELITRLVKLVEKTGDRVVLPDLESGKAVVVMDLDTYERMCVSAPADTADAVSAVEVSRTEAPPARVPEAFAPPAPAPTPADLPAPATSVATSDDMEAESAALPPRDRESRDKPANKAKTKGLQDLTQEELLDRINRDIDEWKTAQDAKRTDELRSVARDLPAFAATTQLEEEERFFLEPIE